MERPKLYSLIGLVVQSSVLALTMRYSRTSQDKEHRYSTSSAVVISELMKVIICLLAMAFTARKTLLSQLALLSNTRELVRSSVPALLYTVQNNLLFVAVTYLDAATFQVTYQLKILTTAIFSVCFLRRQLDIIHWSALVLLTSGVGLAQIPGAVQCNTDTPGDCQLVKMRGRDTIFGLMSVFAMCVSSGFAGVYTEKILKSAGTAGSLWVKNTRLSMSSVFVGLFYLFSVEGSSVWERGFLYGYQAITWLVILQQASLGLLTALVMKYADNIIKGFASSIAIVITTFVSSMILNDLQLSCSFLIGAFVVMGSALLYNVDRNSELRHPDTLV
ncbi:UDP-n-acetylglucosamine transporter [Plakobranchus ocellatus]|uniref:UDP-n-acetylglucosamine transporter n=1 Tax=Plakobranchus ocellatus TaxID=259542 RepID=A0AAV4AYL0_9GAST|nr:UDP-n-acetylglucosamine transporter [Plakobranchus ocellatus]